jgi:succinate dehydrogenase hydrophobic anchor subunit
MIPGLTLIVSAYVLIRMWELTADSFERTPPRRALGVAAVLCMLLTFTTCVTVQMSGVRPAP